MPVNRNEEAQNRRRVYSGTVCYADCPQALLLSRSSVLAGALLGSGPVPSSRNSGCGVNDAGGSYSTLSTSEGL